jgi:hypothetical protein
MEARQAMAEDRPRMHFVQWGQLRANAALARSMKYLRRVRASIEALEEDAAIPAEQSRELQRIVDEIERHVRAANAQGDAGRHDESD